MDTPKPSVLEEHQEDSSQTGAAEEIKKSSRILETKKSIAVLIALLISGCVYHRKDAKGMNPGAYDHRFAEVVFPWRVTKEFKNEYEFKVIPSIAAWLGYPLEFLEGLTSMEFQRLFYLIPPVIYALGNDQDRIKVVTEIAQSDRKESERRHIIMPSKTLTRK